LQCADKEGGIYIVDQEEIEAIARDFKASKIFRNGGSECARFESRCSASA
jgi:hypothetical protein